MIKLIKIILKNKFFGFILGIFISLFFLKLIFFKKRSSLRIIIFSHHRWADSVKLLEREKNICLIIISDFIYNRINSLFNTNPINAQIEKNYKKIRYEDLGFWGKSADQYYYLKTKKKVLNERRKKSIFVSNIVRTINFFTKIDCALTCAIHYSQEQEWASGFHKGGIPFICLHKEQSITDRGHINFRAKHLKKIKQKFQGTAVVAPNKIVRDLFIKSKLIDKKDIYSSGMLKFQEIKKQKIVNKKFFTLFSFGHYSGNIVPKNRRSHYFSKNYDEGFSKLFFNTHKTFILSALNNANITFYIKPKNWADWWINEIENVIKKVSGKDIESIKNLVITNKPSIYLIKNSINVIGFNSTVLLEALALGCKPIIPNFDEAVGVERKNVYFKKFQKNFFIANNPLDLSNKINKCINNSKDKKFNYYFGSEDIFKHYLDSRPHNLKAKTIKIIKQIILNYKKNRKSI